MNNDNHELPKSSGKLMFFVSCPKCKKKFGIEPKYILLYIKRIVGAFGQKFSGVGAMLSAAQNSIGRKQSNQKEG